jgi:hypothetical protein
MPFIANTKYKYVVLILPIDRFTHKECTSHICVGKCNCVGRCISRPGFISLIKKRHVRFNKNMMNVQFTDSHTILCLYQITIFFMGDSDERKVITV